MRPVTWCSPTSPRSCPVMAGPGAPGGGGVFSGGGGGRGRVWGDEFCLWVQGGLDQARSAATAVIGDTRQFLETAGLPVAGLGVSIGIALARAGEGLEDLLTPADGA